LLYQIKSNQIKSMKMKSSTLITSLLCLISLFACSNGTQETTTVGEENLNATKETTSTTENIESMIAIFEIPATDISRAVNFYQTILGIEIEQMEMPGMHMGIFPSEGQAPFGVLVQGEDYVPSAKGVTVYLNAGDDLEPILSKVEENGGKIIMPKTLHADESGYFAILIDSEGNKIGLHSSN
jgi:predicted enzyme related to lactoylglutathione lyase